MQNSGAKCRRRWVELLKSTSFYRITVIPNEVRNPVISSFAKQDFTGWGKPQPLRLGYIHASMAATLAFRGCLRADALRMTHHSLQSTSPSLLITHYSFLIPHTSHLKGAQAPTSSPIAHTSKTCKTSVANDCQQAFMTECSRRRHRRQSAATSHLIPNYYLSPRINL